MKRRSAVLVDGLDLGAAINERLNDVCVPHLARSEEGRVLLEVKDVDYGAIVKEKFDGTRVASQRRCVQRCETEEEDSECREWPANDAACNAARRRKKTANVTVESF